MRLMTAKKILESRSEDQIKENQQQSDQELSNLLRLGISLAVIFRKLLQKTCSCKFTSNRTQHRFTFLTSASDRAIAPLKPPIALQLLTAKKSCQVVDSINMSDTVSVQSFASDNPSVGMQVASRHRSALGSNPSCLIIFLLS